MLLRASCTVVEGMSNNLDSQNKDKRPGNYSLDFERLLSYFTPG